MTPHLHRSSWFVCVATAIVCALVVIPGEIDESYLAPLPTFSHGWPFEFLRRRVDNVPEFRDDKGNLLKLSANWIIESPPDNPPWMSSDSWRLWQASETEWTLRNLFIDATIAMIIVTAVTALWEWRRRHRSNALQFRISEMLIATCLIAVILGWLQHESRAHAHEQELCKSIAAADVYVFDECCAPLWLRRLAGRGFLPNGFFRVMDIDLYPEDVEKYEMLMPLLSQLKHLHTVRLDLEEWQFTTTFDVLARLESLRTLDFSDCRSYVVLNEVILNEKELVSLSRLTQLTELRFFEEEEIEREMLAEIRNRLPRCRITFEIE